MCCKAMVATFWYFVIERIFKSDVSLLRTSCSAVCFPFSLFSQRYLSVETIIQSTGSPLPISRVNIELTVAWGSSCCTNWSSHTPTRQLKWHWKNTWLLSAIGFPGQPYLQTGEELGRSLESLDSWGRRSWRSLKEKEDISASKQLIRLLFHDNFQSTFGWFISTLHLMFSLSFDSWEIFEKSWFMK